MSSIIQIPRLSMNYSQKNNAPPLHDHSDYLSGPPGTSCDSISNSRTESSLSEVSDGSLSTDSRMSSSSSKSKTEKISRVRRGNSGIQKTKQCVPKPTPVTIQTDYLERLKNIKVEEGDRIQEVLTTVYKKNECRKVQQRQENNANNRLFKKIRNQKAQMEVEQDIISDTISTVAEPNECLSGGLEKTKASEIRPNDYSDNNSVDSSLMVVSIGTRSNSIKSKNGPTKRKLNDDETDQVRKIKLNKLTVISNVETYETPGIIDPGITTDTSAVEWDSTMPEMPDGKAPHFPQQPVARQNDDGSLELECFVDANPTPQVKWYYDNKEVENSGRFSANLANKGSDSYSAILTIKELADADAGAYRCAIVNPHGKGNANFNLKLTGFSSPTFVEKPQISSRDDGQVMVMEFRAKSILEPTFVWQKLVGGGAEEIIANSDRIKSVKKLEAGNVYYSALEIKEPTKDKDAGQFICTVKNESGKLTATFTVKFEVPEGAPSFTRKPQILQQTSAGGEPAICFDIGYSARMNPQVTWISPKSKKMKESSRIKFKTNDEGNGNFTAQLELTNYKAKDSGTYTCNIKNDAGEANVELTLNIEGPLDDYADDSEN